jgi:hypothetical protein
MFHEAESGSYRPTTFCDPANTFHEKAALCRAAENSCYFATVNYASAGSPTTSAVVRPDGTALSASSHSVLRPVDQSPPLVYNFYRPRTGYKQQINGRHCS